MNRDERRDREKIGESEKDEAERDERNEIR